MVGNFDVELPHCGPLHDACRRGPRWLVAVDIYLLERKKERKKDGYNTRYNRAARCMH